MSFTIKYRPKNFKDFKGNDAIVAYFVNTPKSDWSKTMLLSGPSGIGKTTLARIIANELADKNEVRELDCAQDRGIDSIRGFIREAMFRPLIGKHKVYIFDEFHQVSKDAQEALLKITEEPPSHLYFIFCSTDPNKIKPTIRNRCNHLTLNQVSDRDIILAIKRVADSEGIEFNDTLKEIGKMIVQEADGIPRNAIMLFDKLHQYTDLSQAQKAIGVIKEEDDSMYPLFVSVLKGDLDGMITNLPDSNYESVRIAIAKMLANKMKRENNPRKYALMMSHFLEPVDNHLGDINLLWAFASLEAHMKEM